MNDDRRTNLQYARHAIQYILLAGALLQICQGAFARPVKDDEKARVLLEQMASTMRLARTLEARMDIVFTRTDKLTGPRVERSKGSMRLRKPNFAYAETTGGMYQLMASDGKSRWSMFGDQSDYVKRDASGDGHNLSFHMAFLVNYFFTQNTDLYDMKKRTGKDMAVRYAGRGSIDGTPTDILELNSVIPEMKKPVSMTFHTGPDHVLRRSIIRLDGERANLLYDATYRDIHIDRDLSVASFAYAPPKDSKPYQSSEPVDKLLKVGKTAPEFTLPTPEKGGITLGSVRRTARAVILNFWFYG